MFQSQCADSKNYARLHADLPADCGRYHPAYGDGSSRNRHLYGGRPVRRKGLFQVRLCDCEADECGCFGPQTHQGGASGAHLYGQGSPGTFSLLCLRQELRGRKRHHGAERRLHPSRGAQPHQGGRFGTLLYRRWCHAALPLLCLR